MNQSEQRLQRLLSAAARSKREISDSPPFGFETAIVAGWRGIWQGGEYQRRLRILQAATIAAVVIMTLTGVWNLLGSPDGGVATALARYALMQLPP